MLKTIEFTSPQINTNTSQTHNRTFSILFFLPKLKKGNPTSHANSWHLHVFHSSKRRLALFSWKDKFLMNANVLSVPQFGRRDGTAWTASLRDTIDLLLVISLSFHYPVKHKRSLLVPLFLSSLYPQPTETACPRREHPW